MRFAKHASFESIYHLDVKSAFHRFMIHPDDQHKTAFTHNDK